jgi:hypothetical protein
LECALAMEPLPTIATFKVCLSEGIRPTILRGHYSLRQNQNAPPAAGRRDRWGTFGRKLILRREPLLVVPDDFRFLGVHVLFLQHAG